MKPCPRCHHEPVWRFAANTTRTRGVQCFILAGCAHLGELAASLRIVTAVERAEVEVRVNERMETEFASYTASSLWNDGTRAAYRARIWPPASGMEWENYDWVKAARVRLANEVELFDAPRPSAMASEREDDCPF